MKLRKPFFLLVICFSLFFLLSACSPSFAQNLVELPEPLHLAILSAVTFVIGFIFTKVAEALPVLADFLGEYVDEVSSAVAGALVIAIQAQLNAIPPEWEGVANTALMLVVAVLAAIGLFRTARKARVPGFRQ